MVLSVLRDDSQQMSGMPHSTWCVDKIVNCAFDDRLSSLLLTSIYADRRAQSEHVAVFDTDELSRTRGGSVVVTIDTKHSCIFLFIAYRIVLSQLTYCPVQSRIWLAMYLYLKQKLCLALLFHSVFVVKHWS